MNLSKIFIERPVATIAIMAAFIIFGFIAYYKLAVSDLPNVDFATITVNASLPGADPETMASTVATPLEKQFSSIAGIDSMSSVNTLGNTQITLQFTLDRNIDAAAQDVANAINQATGSLPTDMPSPPSLKKVNPANTPILYLTFTAEHVPLTDLDEFAETRIAQRLSMVNGVAQVAVFGSAQYAVRIYFNPQALTTRGMDVNDAIAAIQAVHTHQPAGALQGKTRNYILKSDGQLTNAAEFNRAIIDYKNGLPVRVQDIGNAYDSIYNNKVASWNNGNRTIFLAIQRQPDANTVQVIKDIKALLPSLSKDLPGDAKLNIFFDRSVFIQNGLHEVKLTLLLAFILVSAVILLFLGNISATTIAVLALPASIIGTFAFMYLFNFTIDNLSLIALVLAVGFVIDDAIVMIENVVRYLEKGHTPMESALIGSKQISFTIISMTLSLAAVFIPILFMGGLIGRLFNEFAVVVAIAILLSGVVSLTLTPMMCSRLLRAHSAKDSIFPRFERFFESSRTHYESSLRWILERRKWALIMMIVIAILTVFLFQIVAKGFIPTQDSGILFGNTQVPIGTTFADFSERQQAVAKIIQQDPNVESVNSTVGQGGSATVSSNLGQIVIRLKPLSQRRLNADAIIQQLRQKIIPTVPGIQVFLTSPPSIRIGGVSAKSNYQYVLQSTEWSTLQSVVPLMIEKMSQIPGVQDVNSDLQITNPQLKFHILRDRAAALGVTPALIETTLYNAYGLNQITSIYTSTNEYSIIAGIDPLYQTDPDSLNNLYIRSNNNKLVPLNAVTEMTYEAAPVSVNHYGQLPAVVISFNVAPGTALSDVSGKIENIAKEVLPSSVSADFIGSAQSFKSLMGSMPLLLLMTILVIYLILAILYEHFGHPLTILTALPLAGFGAILILIVFHKELNIFSFVGLIMLVGLVKKNGIMMVDFAIEAKRHQNISSFEAIVQASTIRFRPIMMTTVAALLATLPMAIGFGAAGETRQAMGITIVGGLLFSQLLTLYITPAFYLYMEEWGEAISKRWERLLAKLT